MASLAELRARREEAAGLTKQAIAGLREEAIVAKKDERQKKALAKAAGVKPEAAELIATAVNEIAEIRNLVEAAEGELRRVKDGDSAIRLQEEVAALNAEIEGRLQSLEKEAGEAGHVDRGYIMFLVEVQRANRTPGAILYFTIKAVERGFYEELPPERGEEAIRAQKEAKAAGEKLSPERSRWIYKIYDPKLKLRDGRGLRYFRAVWFEGKEQKGMLLQTQVFSAFYRQLCDEQSEAYETRKASIKVLEAAVNLKPQDAFAGGVGTMKLTITPESPWEFSIRDGTERAKIHGDLYVEVPKPRVMVVVLVTGGLGRTCEIFGLTEPGLRKEIAFGENFSSLKALNGSELQNPGRSQAFLCKAAGLVKPSPSSSEEDGGGDGPTQMASAMAAATERNRGRTSRRDSGDQGEKPGRGRSVGGKREKDRVRREVRERLDGDDDVGER